MFARVLAGALLMTTAFGQGRGGQNRQTPLAEGAQNTSQNPGQPPAANAPPAVETTSKTQHSVTIGAKKIAYTATAGTLVL
jgi:carboxypeptidase C (cathepsin A)